jgi:glycosyltransferase involved in cell wall biosynthesis
MKTLLTILIPTWNRRHNLDELLTILMPQVRARTDVEVIISNNGSIDDTAEYLEGWKREPRVRVIHQPCNLGLNVHLAWLYGQSTSRFLWLVGDDDLMAPDMLQLVCNELYTHPELGWIHLPGTHLLRRGLPPILTRCPMKNEYVDRGRSLVPTYINYIGWVSSNIIRTEFLQTNLPSLKFSTIWWPQDLLIQSIADYPAVVISARKMIAGAQSTWAEDSHRILMYELPTSILENSCLTSEEKRRCLEYRFCDHPSLFRALMHEDFLFFMRILLFCPSLLVRAKLLSAGFQKLKRILTILNQRTRS